MPPRPTIKDIAEDCDVSLSTVSLVLNNNSRISDKTRDRVLASVKKKGYRPNNQARGLASKSSHVLNVTVPNLSSVFSDVYFGQIINGIYETAASYEYKMMLDVANLKYIRNYEFLSILQGRRADGMLFIGSSLYDQYLLAFEDMDFPFILLNHYFPGHNLNYICADYAAAGTLAAEHLTGLGHRRIGMIIGTHIQTVTDYAEHFMAAAAKGGVRPDDIHQADGRFSEKEGYMAAKELWARHPNLTAFVCANDKMALGALQFAEDHQLSVPGRLSIMGMDDIPATSYTQPKITTIRPPLQEIGRRGAEGILNLFRNQVSSIQERLPVQLVVRESTGPAPA